MDLKEYWPEFVSEIKEFKEINIAENDEVGKLKDSVSRVYANQFFNSMDEESVKRYEEMAGIHALESETIDFRRTRLIDTYFNRSPFNKLWLERKLNAALGQDRHRHKIENDELALVTSTDEIESIKSLRRELRKDIPATMDIRIGLERSSEHMMHVGTVARVGKITTITPSNQVTINVKNNNEIYVGTYVRTVKKITIGGN